MEFFNEKLFSSWKKEDETAGDEQSTKQSLGSVSHEGCSKEGDKADRTVGNWCEAVSSAPNVNAKHAWKNGTEKLAQTLNNVRATFGVFSQKIKKSTKKRQPLINMESPSSPATPYTKSRAALGRTPTKLYSPFSIDTPKGKENISHRFINEVTCVDTNAKGGRKRPRRTKLNLNVCEDAPSIAEAVLSNDLLHTQIGIYEFQSVANRIIQKCVNH